MYADKINHADYVNNILGMAYDAIEFNCWQCVQKIQADLFGRILPSVVLDITDRRAVLHAFETHEPEAHGWIESPTPVNGAVVMMAKRTLTAHAGVFLSLDEGIIVHCDQPHGVAVERPLELQVRCWGRLQYFIPGKVQ